MTLRPPRPTDLADVIASHNEQLRDMRALPEFTWDNFRFGEYTVSFTGGDGLLLFSPPFDHQCFGITAIAHHPSGFSWNIGYRGFSEIGAQLTAWQYETVNPVGWYSGLIILSINAMGW